MIAPETGSNPVDDGSNPLRSSERLDPVFGKDTSCLNTKESEVTIKFNGDGQILIDVKHGILTGSDHLLFVEMNNKA